MFAMHSVTSTYRRWTMIVLWLLVICLSAHFLHDLQPGHIDFHGSDTASRGCTLAIHSGILGGFIPGIAVVFLIFSVVNFSHLFHYSGSRAVPLPPPIPA